MVHMMQLWHIWKDYAIIRSVSIYWMWVDVMQDYKKPFILSKGFNIPNTDTLNKKEHIFVPIDYESLSNASKIF